VVVVLLALPARKTIEDEDDGENDYGKTVSTLSFIPNFSVGRHSLARQHH
jgi:hypothetical protein